jgi:ribosomal protein L31
MEAIVKIQQELKAPKGQFNAFGKYKYRNCEDIIEALKPIIHPLGFWLTLSDEPVQMGERFYIRAEAVLTDGEKTYKAIGYAREEETKKGMDGSQVTGAASSYARKYALNGLLAIDDSKDSDKTNEEEVKKETLDQLHTKWAGAVEFIKKGGSIDAIKEKYSLSETDENELRKHAKN